MKALFFVLSAIFFMGCGPSQRAVKDYTIGQVKTINVGETIISWGYTNVDWADRPMNAQKASLIFNGRDANTLFIAYREEYENMQGSFAKPAFNNELKYAANQKIIRYKDHEIEVISVNDREMVVKILK